MDGRATRSCITPVGQAAGRTITTIESLGSPEGLVTSVDWAAYPILRFPDVLQVQVALINRPDQPRYGAGEAARACAVFPSRPHGLKRRLPNL